MRNIKGKAVRAEDKGEKEIDTEHKKGGKVESREGEHEGTKSEGKVKAAGTGGPKDVAGDMDHNPDSRRSPEAFDKNVQSLELHHDRLCRIEEHVGMHHWSDDMKSQDQKAMGPKGARGEGEHSIEKKGTPKYGRKHN